MYFPTTVRAQASCARVSIASVNSAGETLSDVTTLSQLGVAPGQALDLHVQVLGVVEGSRDESPSGDTQARVGHTSVEVERAKQAKPFLGGYRHAITGVEYHHATAQTASNRKPPDQVCYKFKWWVWSGKLQRRFHPIGSFELTMYLGTTDSKPSMKYTLALQHVCMYDMYTITKPTYHFGHPPLVAMVMS